MRVDYQYVVSPNDIIVTDLAFKGYFVKEGCSITPLGGYTIEVSSGTLCLNFSETVVSATTLTLDAPVSSPYKAIVYYSNSFTFTKGEEESPYPSNTRGRNAIRPRAPLFPDSVTPIAEIWVEPNSSIGLSDIYDYRIFSQVGTGGAAPATIEIRHTSKDFLVASGDTLSDILVETLNEERVFRIVAAKGTYTLDVYSDISYGQLIGFRVYGEFKNINYTGTMTIDLIYGETLSSTSINIVGNQTLEVLVTIPPTEIDLTVNPLYARIIHSIAGPASYNHYYRAIGWRVLG